MISLRLPDFSLQQIMQSGQCFRMTQEGNEFAVIADDAYLRLRQEGEQVTFFCTKLQFEQLWRPFFDLDTDYSRFRQAVGKRDFYMQNAVQAGFGLRILRQPLWQTIVCFIISQQNNIARICGCVSRLCALLGTRCTAEDGTEYFAFPTPQQLAEATVEQLAPVRLGYRAKYLTHAARQVVSGEVDLDKIAQMRHKNAVSALCELSGVGVKVAECVCLFALHHLSAFPIDTHIRQMLDAHYAKGFPFSRFRGFAGVMQQYAFYYELHGAAE